MVTSDDTLKAFGIEVRAARVAAGWTLADLAEEAFGNSDRKGYVSQIENGRKQITPLTVGKLAEALNLPDAATRPMLDNADAPEQETYDIKDARAAKLLNAAETEGAPGIAEGLLIALAYDYAEGETTDLQTAYRGLKVALETARDMAARAALPGNTDAGLNAVRAEVQRLNEADDVDGADAAITDALEKKQAETLALLDLGVQQARLRNDPRAAADRVLQKLRMEATGPLFAALRAERETWYEKGRDKGLVFDTTVAIHLAHHTLTEAKTPDERGTALNDLGVALQTLGQRESGTERLEAAVTACENALLERTRDKVPLDWAMTQNNLGTALQTLGERESGTERLEAAVTAYENALLERTRDRVPLDWATTQNNLGNAMKTLGQRESSTERLEAAVTAYENALLEWTRDRVPLDWAMTQNNLGNALRTLGERESSTERLEAAVTAYENALLEGTRDRVPLDWAMTQGNLAILSVAFFDKTKVASHLEEAKAYVTAARAVFVEAGADHYVGVTDSIQSKIASREAAL